MKVDEGCSASVREPWQPACQPAASFGKLVAMSTTATNQNYPCCGGRARITMTDGVPRERHDKQCRCGQWWTIDREGDNLAWRRSYPGSSVRPEAEHFTTV